jgi:hypothetical protein
MKNESMIAGALFDFVGYLTTLDEPVTFSGKHDATAALDLLGEWASQRGLDLDEADVKGWVNTCKGGKGEG